MQGEAMNKSKEVVQQGNNPIKHANNEFRPLHHKFISFMGSFQIRANFVISWVHIVYTQMSCII